MKLFWWMLTGSLILSFALILLLGMELRYEVLFGMLGPLVSALVSWLLMIRQHEKNQLGMTRLLIRALAVKVVFFALYIIVLLNLNLVQPVPFALCFAGFYLILHMVEAMGLHRLQAAGFRDASPTIHHRQKTEDTD
jgi:hypothetical protein